MRGHRGWGFTEVSTRFRENLPWLLGGHRVYGDGKVSISPCLDRRLVRLAGFVRGSGVGVSLKTQRGSGRI